MKGIITAIDDLKQEALIKVERSSAPFAFGFERFEGARDDLFVGLEVEVVLSAKKEIAKVIPDKNAKKPENLKYLELTKSVEDCVVSYFNDIRELLSRYKSIDDSAPQIDFLRIRRFLFTAYNDLYDLDNSVYNPKLEHLRIELGKIQKEFELFRKKTGYPIKYSYDKVFLRQQGNYLKLEEKIEATQGFIRSATLKERPLADRLKEKEKKLLAIEDKKSQAYFDFEKEVKELRKRYVDLLHFISLQRDLLAELSALSKMFVERYFQEFVDLYQPLSMELERKLLWLLNTKAYELDSNLWDRAKQSKLIRQFFMDSGITGTYSSKTFLKYYLRSLDKDKLRNENKELFSLLAYLESISKKSIFVIRHRFEAAVRCKYLLENFDKELQVSIIKDPLDALKVNDSVRPDIILLDMDLTGINPFELAQKYRQMFDAEGKSTLFCLFVNDLTSDLFTHAKKVGIKHFLRNQATDDEFIDSMRTIL